MKALKKILYMPFEAYLYGSAYLVHTWLYIQIIFSSTAIFAMISCVSFSFLEIEHALYIVYASSFLGFIFGIFWAENERKTHGIINFHGYLLSTPEIEGWKDKNGKPVDKH
ncbi:hypothetical protein [Pseudoalteromonas spongiae]|uniref:hypothetical protein n=1 Tax=Pseudoalteromonas spongiae TaxID=298657 RepID=UPI00110B34BA|nr:hypothetical protein [Pseudoalteromonas spongiae]TMO83522.1 hypothetical protein CWC15_14625 [Pseudoalteromonas spongiae]